MIVELRVEKSLLCWGELKKGKRDRATQGYHVCKKVSVNVSVGYKILKKSVFSGCFCSCLRGEYVVAQN